MCYVNAQAELEHRTPKSRYTRTSRKGFEKQLAKIERLQASVRRIRQKVRKPGIRPDKDSVPESSSVKYHIGKTQNNPMNLGTFLHEYRSDPATQVCVSLYLVDRMIIWFAGLCREAAKSFAT